MKSCTVPQEISCDLNIFSKLLFRPVFPYCTLNKVHRDDSNRYGLLSSNLHWFFTISTKSDWFDPKICRATLVLLSWCDISVILQSYFDHILTGGRKCCLNVIPAGSFSLSLSLPLSFFFSFPHANKPVGRLLPIIFTDYSVEIC